MSLKIWLPLIRNAVNQGASSYAITTPAGVSFATAGKLGTCASATTSSNITINVPDLESIFGSGKQYTIACWVKLTGLTSTNGWLIKIGSNTCGLWWAKSAPRWVWNENDGGKRCANETVSADYSNWHHLCIIVDKSISGKITTTQYVNGILADGYPGSTFDEPSTKPVGTTITIDPYIASVNDVRIYDHCLSKAEVHELSQGLVCHYKLDDIINPNLLRGELNSPGSWVKDGCTATLDGDAIKVVESGSGNRRIYSVVANVWTPINSTFTVSFDAKAEIDGYKMDANRSNGTGTNMCTFTLTKDWRHYSGQIINTAAVPDGTLSLRGQTSGGGTYWIKNIKLERGPIETAYVPGFQGYDFLEYLESTGTEGIDTGLVPQTGYQYNFKYAIHEFSTTNSKYLAPFISYTDEATNCVRVCVNNGSTTDILAQFNSKAGGGGLNVTGVTSAADQIVEGFISKTSYNFHNLTTNVVKAASNSTDLFPTKGTTNSATMKLFTYASNSTDSIKARIYYFDTLNGGSLVQRLVPVRRCSDGMLGMLNTVNGTFLTNIKIGSFIAGPLLNKTIKDSSGYGYHGTVIGFPIAEQSTPKYDSSTHIASTSHYIKCGSFRTSGFSNSYSFSWWSKCGSWEGLMNWGFSDGIRLNGIYNGTLWNTGDGSNNPLYNPGTTTQVTAPTTNAWHHFVMTGDGTNCKVYKDGVHWATAKTYKSISGTQIYINGWNDATTYSYANLYMSDFRVYATALSADDIKALYQTEAKVDKGGNIHASEFIEFDNESITNNSQIIGHNMLELCPNLHYDKNIYVEPDGSKWVRIVHHNNPNGGVFASSSLTWSKGVYENEDRWYDAEQTVGQGTSYEFMVKQATTNTATEVKYRWIQTESLLTATYTTVKPDVVTRITTTGYTDGGFGGIYIKNGNARLCIANSTSSNWYGAIGCWTVYQGGIPGYPNTTITTGYIDLYFRIDDFPNTGAKILKDIGFSANNFIEM